MVGPCCPLAVESISIHLSGIPVVKEKKNQKNPTANSWKVIVIWFPIICIVFGACNSGIWLSACCASRQMLWVNEIVAIRIFAVSGCYFACLWGSNLLTTVMPYTVFNLLGWSVYHQPVQISISCSCFQRLQQIPLRGKRVVKGWLGFARFCLFKLLVVKRQHIQSKLSSYKQSILRMPKEHLEAISVPACDITYLIWDIRNTCRGAAWAGILCPQLSLMNANKKKHVVLF